MRPHLATCIRLRRALVWLAVTSAASACRQVPDRDVPGTPDAGEPPGPARGTPATLDVGSWNLAWFGAVDNGPTNEGLQLANVARVMAGAELDVWGLEEVVSAPQFARLVGSMPGYAGLLANDPGVVDGPAYYSDFGDLEQKVALVYRTSIATVRGARVILTDHDDDFAGRPPLEVLLRVSLNGASEDLAVIVVHPKCCTDSASYQRRVQASIALKAYLDATPPAAKVWVIGDWNDDVDVSITSGEASPYRNFATDSARYVIETQALSEARVASTVRYSAMIDHHMVSAAAAAAYVAGSAEVFRADAFIPSYGTTTSDHYPVVSRYTLGK